MDKKKSTWLAAASGLGIGFLNGIFGAGGGMLAVPALRKCSVETKQAHATSIAVILPLSLISAVIYYLRGAFTIADCLPYLPGGSLGALAGAFLLKKLPDFWIRKAFAVMILYASIKLFFR